MLRLFDAADGQFSDSIPGVLDEHQRTRFKVRETFRIAPRYGGTRGYSRARIRRAMDKDFWSGLTKGLFGRIQFGGVVGKVCLMFAVSAIAAAFVLRVAEGNFWVAIGGGLIVLCGLLVVLAVLFFADRHPELAVLDGTHVLQYQRNMIRSKGLPAMTVEAVAVEATPATPVLDELQEQEALPPVAAEPAAEEVEGVK